ncbi:GcrA family cell cycle regulator [Paracoccus sanguinis]|uniref:GcrA family cell cycle regulator n=1 Tax=Paracoccus sanguinis TaxID=1545044 RepID=UPI0009DF264D
MPSGAGLSRGGGGCRGGRAPGPPPAPPPPGRPPPPRGGGGAGAPPPPPPPPDAPGPAPFPPHAGPPRARHPPRGTTPAGSPRPAANLTAEPGDAAASPAPTARDAAPLPEDDAETAPEPAPQPVFTPRRPIVPAGQPLPPQPSANEISPEALASVREVEKRARKLSLMELTERTCKWPIGDPATDKFWFCGLPAQPGKPYCEAHVGVAFQPMSARRDRRR